MSFSCEKIITVTINAAPPPACWFSTCVTQPAFLDGGNASQPAAYSSLYCYSLSGGELGSAGLCKYNTATNARDLKAAIPGGMLAFDYLAYHITNKLFYGVGPIDMAAVYDPVSESITDSYNIGVQAVTAVSWNFLYVHSLGKIYLITTGLDFGYLDPVSKTYVSLGPMNPVNTYYCLAYSPVANAFYIPYSNGGITGLAKVDAVTGAYSEILVGVFNGLEATWDSTRNLMVLFSASAVMDLDTSTDTVASTTPVLPITLYHGIYVPITAKIYGLTNTVSPPLVVYDITSGVLTTDMADYSYIGLWPTEQGAFLSLVETPALVRGHRIIVPT